MRDDDVDEPKYKLLLNIPPLPTYIHLSNILTKMPSADNSWI